MEKGWEGYSGYSSVGFLTPDSTLSLKSIYRKTKSFTENILRVLTARQSAQEIDVETTTLDREFINEEIDFLKIDVQGAEEKALKGANNMLSAEKIHILYVEWSGEKSIEELLQGHDYHIYDSTYIAGPIFDDIRPFEDIGFHVIDKIQLSTGNIAYEMLLERDDISPAEAIRKVKSKGLGWVQTDLIAVSSKSFTRFSDALSLYLENRSI